MKSDKSRYSGSDKSFFRRFHRWLLPRKKSIFAKTIQSLLVPFLAFILLYELFNLLTTDRIGHY